MNKMLTDTIKTVKPENISLRKLLLNIFIVGCIIWENLNPLWKRIKYIFFINLKTHGRWLDIL
jgi:hypothetical protein